MMDDPTAASNGELRPHTQRRTSLDDISNTSVYASTTIGPEPKPRTQPLSQLPDSGTIPSSSNGSAQNTHGAGGSGGLEPDTCRICRGEATPQEPLFYPCKCSGSIKYVHQDCLMEWLSHSQKKHCELCKTPFRFTKLYAPTMPKQLPLLVFARHLAKYFVRTLLAWCRVALVASVWLGWLPYLTRWEWSFFFWISEEGLVSPTAQQQSAASLAASSAASAAASLSATTVCPSSPLLAATTTPAAAGLLNQTAVSAAAAALLVDPAAKGLFDGVVNATMGDSSSSVFATVFNAFFDAFGISDMASLLSTANGTQRVVAAAGPPSLLSEVGFLRTLTRYPAVNRTIVYALEGQIITVLVIVCFILVILVRDYVVQQQPEINMRAAFAAAEAAEGGGGGGGGGNEEDGPVNGQDGPDREGLRRRVREAQRRFDQQQEDDSEWETDSDNSGPDDAAGFLRPFSNEDNSQMDHDTAMAWFQRPIPTIPSPSTTRASSPTLDVSATAGLNIRGEEKGEASSSSVQIGPNAWPERPPSNPDHDADAAGHPGEGATVHEYLRVYRQAGGDPDEILKIARDEHLEDRLQYWLRLTQQVVDKRQSSSSLSDKDGGSGGAAAPEERTDDAMNTQDHTDISTPNGDSRRQWHWYEKEGGNDNFLSSLPDRKGKGRADEADETDENEEELDTKRAVNEFEFGLRPRANTDGPKRPEGSNPLANNNWAFPDLPPRSSSKLPPPTLRPPTSSSNAPVTSRFSEIWDEELNVSPPTPEPGQTDMSDIAEEDDADDHMTPALPPVRGSSAGGSSTTAAAVATPPTTLTASNSDDAGEGGAGENRPSAEADLDAAVDEAGNTATAIDLPNGEATNRNANNNNNINNNEARPPTAGLFGSITDFMWRDLDNIDPAELPPLAADPLFDNDEGAGGPFGGGDAGADQDDGDAGGDVLLDDFEERDRDVMEAAAAAGLDAEAIDDAEDLEGVMELLGMRGPITALFQNAIFCAFLVTVTLLLGIFLPYNIGRLSVWLIANPMRPVMMLFSLSKLLQDVAAVVLGGCAFMLLSVVRTAASLTSWVTGWGGATGVASTASGSDDGSFLASTLAATWNLCATAAVRVLENFLLEPPFLSAGEIRNFSAISHEALLSLKGHVAATFAAAGRGLLALATGDLAGNKAGLEALLLGLANLGGTAWAVLRALPAVLSDPASWVITLPDAPLDGSVQVNPAFAYWDGTDRCLAILLGYSSLCLVAGLYLHRGTPFSSGQTGQEWEASIIDGLNQASGVMKVILIIGIEMLVFPLYCGLLLDVALLPLFEDTTIASRVYFTLHYPLTSIFVHWFVGTGYMFHFALFVSMCRKIMRKGVLYFIRDPDDPEFHPVRDVLERNVTTQLRKILFSAFVYGALVVVCLGGVVWGLAYAAPGVLPVHYSSNEPVLEFPIDLLFYNFLMPLAIKFFKPSDGLHAMYTWWFRKSARVLRLTWFLFGERKIDEEGVLVLKPGRQAPWLARQFLALRKDGEVGPRTLREVLAFDGFYAAKGRSDKDSLTARELSALRARKDRLVASGQLVPDGRFVYAPASDQIKIPKGQTVFVYASESDGRVDPAAAAAASAHRPDNDIATNEQYQYVYVPPHFRLRIFFFIAFIWLFAAVTGVSFTILPLLFGRTLFRALIPAHIRTNDIYAFSIGIYVLGSAAYLLFHARALGAKAVDTVRGWWLRRRRAATPPPPSHRQAAKATASTSTTTTANGGATTADTTTLTTSSESSVQLSVFLASAYGAGQTAARIVWRAAKLLYAYFFILVVFPLLATALVELYVLIPLHTYMYPPGTGAAPSGGGADDGRHTVRVIQSWTLGLLYLKLGARTVTAWHADARLASAVRAVLRRGRLDPDVRLLTRAFVVPGLVLGALAIGLPLVLARGVVASEALLPPGVDPNLVYRLSFPGVAALAAAGWALGAVAAVFGTWKVRIRDEAYLIGERLHNFGAASSSSGGAGAGGAPQARRAWRAGGGRL